MMNGRRARRECSAPLGLLLCITCALLGLSPASCFQPSGCAATKWQLVRYEASHSVVSSGRNANTLDRAAAVGAFDVQRRGRHEPLAGLAPPPQQQQLSMSMSMGFPMAEGMRGFFASSSISSVMNAANNVPPVYYFVYLLAAGVGVPVSEDVMVIFVGTLLGSKDFLVKHKAACVAWCYVGVVLSDLLTYGIGAGFRRGLFNPLRRILFKDLGETAVVDGSDDGTTGKEKDKQATNGNTQHILNRIRRSGKFVGVAERFALGVRGPMTLLCGFTGVPVKGFAVGVALGALFGTVPIQLTLGYVLRDRPATVAAIGAAFLSFYTLGPPIMAAVGGATLWFSRSSGGNKDGSGGQELREGEKLELGAEGAGI